MIKRIAIMGCGSLGTILGAYLNKAGLDVMMVDAWKEHVDVLNRKGATVTGSVQMNVPVKACTPDQMDGIYDLIIYMAKQTFNDIAIPQMLAHCGDDTIICTCQNGLPELAVAKYYPKDKIMGATVGWPATFVGPGTSSLTCSPDAPTFEFHLGRLNGELDEKVYEVQAVLEKMCPGRVNLTKNLMADRWSTLPSIFGLDFNKLFDYNDIAGQNAAIATVQKIFGTIQGKASMLQDLEKGRKCEIRFIDGVVADEGKKLGIPTPYTDAVVAIVSEIEDKKRPLQNNLDAMPDLPIA